MSGRSSVAAATCVCVCVCQLLSEVNKAVKEEVPPTSSWSHLSGVSGSFVGLGAR